MSFAVFSVATGLGGRIAAVKERDIQGNGGNCKKGQVIKRPASWERS